MNEPQKYDLPAEVKTLGVQRLSEWIANVGGEVTLTLSY